ncbi:class I SAM-dependent methyltransferase [Niallia circulans]|jgi:16S rRNA (guanine1207-N2)-methyltransferase|uniref:16S rRNA methyltransferase n=1 Tax=Niallia circulans TaxID=1397 RepID=A0A0J1L5B3_NIACI|nr:class I SAM-dependent methyltransferase [Niallia circulans]KLV24120.1 16S rRNA methyltransferase [Niallia circulans]MED5102806.1 class I SAM-dependent methyltransferase [Niallia circulans]PAD23386.1 class I SAM-dependent methyltransferase [Niallia circulans]PAD85817.1 class I SAM-dependent methyltransferase [Niallia circulans]PAE10229.1 class I SAM-dependent methyltransferase [Niallia circulans]
MTEHYYSRTQNVNSDPNYWNFTLKGNTIRFKTDNGVFSKKEVDFGSRLLIETYTLPDLDGDILDVGCGYGPIGLSIAKTSPNRMVHMVDVNLRAIELAEENARQNGVENVRIYESDRLLRVKGKKFASILTNPPIRAGKKVVHDIFEQSYDCLVPNGELWVVIQKKQGAPSAIAKLEEFFKEVNVVEKKKGYFIIQAKKID